LNKICVDYFWRLFAPSSQSNIFWGARRNITDASNLNTARKFPLLPAGPGSMAGFATVDLLLGAPLLPDIKLWARVQIANAFDADNSGSLEGSEGFATGIGTVAGNVIPGEPPPPVTDLRVIAAGEGAVQLEWGRSGVLGSLAERYRVEQAAAADGGAVPEAATMQWTASRRAVVGASAAEDLLFDADRSGLGDARLPADGTTVAFVAGGLLPGIAYQFRVRAGNLNGAGEDLLTLPSPAVAAYTAGPPPPPAGVHVAYYLGATGARLAWADAGPGAQGGRCGARFYAMFLVRADGSRTAANGTLGFTRNASADVDLTGGAPDNVTVASCCSALLPAAVLASAGVADGGLAAGPPPAPVHPYIRPGLPCAYSVPLRVVPRPPPSGTVQGLDVVYVAEGAVTLAWTPVNGADRYQVLSRSG
jgi:hypothetical protein